MTGVEIGVPRRTISRARQVVLGEESIGPQWQGSVLVFELEGPVLLFATFTVDGILLPEVEQRTRGQSDDQRVVDRIRLPRLLGCDVVFPPEPAARALTPDWALVGS